MNTYQVKFPASEVDCKKVLAYQKKQEGAWHYRNPVLENFKEDFNSSILTVLAKANYKDARWKVHQFSRMLPINGQPKKETIEQSISIFAARNLLSEDEAKQILVENESNFISAIATALISQ
jgi:hypothetical protein